jgi:hypothetical protein
MATLKDLLPNIPSHFRPRRPGVPSALLAFLLLTRPAFAAGQDAVPPDILEFSRKIPKIFEELGNVEAREEMVQQVYRSGRLFDMRTLVSDYQVAHLDTDPSALWEFRFVRMVDGRKVRDFDRRVSDFFLLRHASARDERIRVTRQASDHSLPHCYWHNLTLVLGAFGEGMVPNYEWTETSEGAKFRQVRGPGVPEDYFNSQSPRHYPAGKIVFTKPSGSLSEIQLEFPREDTLVRMSLRFSMSGVPGVRLLPREYEVLRIRRASGEVLSRTTLRYSDFRRFSVATDEKTGESVEK